MRYLILSDIHANWQALEAVLKKTRGGYDQVLCCGDLIGYGADPNPVLDWARANVAAVIRGNHDKAAVGLEDLEWFNDVARAAALWTHDALTPENTEYVRALPRGPAAVDGFQLVHGSPLNEDEYVVTAADAGQVFSYTETPLTFFGHTHLQGGFIWCRTGAKTIKKPGARQSDMLLELDPDCAYLINPGSVGQPRDGDPRAGYVIYDPEDRFLFYHRLDYDIENAQAKIHQAGLPGLLAERLEWGR